MRGGNGIRIESSIWRSGGDRSCVLLHTRPPRRKVTLEGKMVVERDRRLIRALSAESPPRGGPLMSQVGERGTVGKREVGACVVVHGEFREGRAVQMPRP